MMYMTTCFACGADVQLRRGAPLPPEERVGLAPHIIEDLEHYLFDLDSGEVHDCAEVYDEGDVPPHLLAGRAAP